MQTEVESKYRAGYALVCCGDNKNENGWVPPGFPVLKSKSLQAARRYRHLFVLCSALNLPEAAEFVTEMNREHRLQALFVKTDVDPVLLPQMVERAGLRSVRNMLAHSDSSLPRRVLRAWRLNAQTELISCATAAHDRLIAVSCEPKTYEIRFDRIPALKQIPPKQRTNFEVAEDGSYIWWPGPDIHIDLDAIRAAIDPASGERARRNRQSHGREYGAAIAALRKASALRQADIPGVSERQLRRIEQSGAVSLHTLELLSKAHRMTMPDYLNAVAHQIKRGA